MSEERAMPVGAGETGPPRRSGGWTAAGAAVLGLLPMAGALGALLGPLAPSRHAPLETAVPARRGRRIAAGAADLALAGFLMLVPWAGWALAAGFLLFRDALLDGRGFGKRLAGLTAVALEEGGARPLAGDWFGSFARNATVGLPLVQLLLLPVEGVLVLLGARRVGERLGPPTAVVADPRSGGMLP